MNSRKAQAVSFVDRSPPEQSRLSNDSVPPHRSTDRVTTRLVAATVNYAIGRGIPDGGILDEAREAMAKKLLSDPKLSIERIAEALHYSDGRAFRRAFSRWTGMTPTGYRRTQAES